MISYKNGRYRSLRTRRETRQGLETTLANLKPEEQEALQLILADLEKNQKGGIFDKLSNLDFKSEPVDLKTFIYDPYYLGNTCDVLFPKLFDDLKELFEGEYNEAVFTGSIGWGKTFAASIGICYFLYQLSLMKSPQKSFGIASTSYIDIVAFSVTEELAKKVAFDNIVGKIEASEYFQQNFPFEVTKREIRFPNNVRVAPRATTDNSALGLNVVAGLLDETDFMTSKKVRGSNTRVVQQDRAEAIYNNIKRRMKSRFQKQGKLPGILFVVSSKNAKDSFSERLIKSAMKDSESKGTDALFVRDYATWEVKPAEDLSTTERFWVLVGNDQIPSRIVRPDELESLRKDLPDDCVLIDVPEDYRNDFERDLEGSIRDTAGIATVSVSPFIQRREKIVECISLYQRTYPGMGHPFTVEEFIPGQLGGFIWEKMVQETRERGFLGHWETRFRPKINPRAVRHVHIDPSLSGDATGVCVAHVSGYKDVIRKAADGVEYKERAPVYTVDFMLRIKPPIGDEIIMGDVRQFIYDMSAHGYVITTATLDGWQSADAIQTLAKKGYNSELLSVDRTMDPYENMKTALYEGRILMYSYEPLLRELRTIQKDLIRKKVDHPIGGSKDVSDALAGCLFTLSQHSSAEPLPIVRVDANMNDDPWMPMTDNVVRGGSANQQPMWQDIMPPFMIGSGKGWGNDGE
jgi:hypothetical protein